MVFCHLYDARHEAVLLFVEQRNDSSRIDVLMVEMAVDHEYFTVQLMDSFRVVGTETLFWSQREVESRVFGQAEQTAQGFYRYLSGDSDTAVENMTAEEISQTLSNYYSSHPDEINNLK